MGGRIAAKPASRLFKAGSALKQLRPNAATRFPTRVSLSEIASF